LGFNGDLYPTAGADVVMTTSGDMVKYQTGARARLGIGSANQILQVKSSLPSWETVDLADTVLTTAGDVLYENATPELARLPISSNGDVLTLAGGLPTWATPSAGGGDFEKIAQTILTGAGTSLKIAGQSINLDPTSSPTYTQLYVVGNLVWDDETLPAVTATINDGSSFIGVTQKMGSSVTSSVYSNTATIPIAMGLARNMAPSFFMWIGMGYESASTQSLMFNWHYTGNDDTQVMGGGRLVTTASSTFTDIDLQIDTETYDFDVGSTLTLYGVKA